MTPPLKKAEKNQIPSPKNMKEIPGFLRLMIGGFFKRLFFIMSLVWKTNPWILFGLVMITLLNGLIPVASAYLSAEILNNLASGYIAIQDYIGSEEVLSVAVPLFRGVAFLFLLQFGCMFIRRLSSTFESVLLRISSELVSNHIHIRIMEKAKEVDLASFDSPEFYEKLENANREAGHRPLQILHSTFNMISTIISLVGFVIVLWQVHPLASLIIIAIAAPSALVSFIYRKKYWRYMRSRSRDRRELSYYSNLMVNKDMVKEIRIFGLSDTFIGRYNVIFAQYFAGLKKLFRQEGLWNFFLGLCSIIANCILFVYVGWGVCIGKWQVGNYSLYTGALNSVASGIATLISTTATIYEGTLFIDNLILFLNEKKTIFATIDQPIKPKRKIGHSIEFCDVSFRYPGTEKDVLEHLNIKIDAGESVALVGLNGAGKTTFLKLLTRLYDPTQGKILLDGIDLRHYDVDALYQIYGIIFQDFGKYAVKVSENISFGDIDSVVSKDKVQKAARSGNADEFISHLPLQYDTPLMRYFDDDGMELSIGQWQKLSIARAFYSNSDILILDEPTASLDALAEQEIYNKFDTLRKGKTSFFVSHRLSSTTTSTKIIVLEYGKIIEQGDHASLMKAKGRYYDLFITQAQRYLDQSHD